MFRLLVILILLICNQDSDAILKKAYKNFIQKTSNFLHKNEATADINGKIKIPKNEFNKKSNFNSKRLPFAASGIEYNFKPQINTITTTINKNKWSRLITTNIEINPYNEYNDNLYLGLYSNSHKSGLPKFKSYKFGEENNLNFEIKKSPNVKKKSKSLIERFREEDKINEIEK
ncbi:hypothetical protein Mgra_00006960, partial [Meloidogyne graminicola]